MEWPECGNTLYNYPRIELAGCVLRGFQVELQDSSARTCFNERAAMPKCVAMPTGQADLQQKSKNSPCSSTFFSEFLFVRGHVNCTERVMALNFCLPLWDWDIHPLNAQRCGISVILAGSWSFWKPQLKRSLLEVTNLCWPFEVIAGQDDPKNGNSGCGIHHLTRFVSVSYSLLVATCSAVLEFSESMLFCIFPIGSPLLGESIGIFYV